jgi:hypothetical protein
MAESFLGLTLDDQREALLQAASTLKRPAHLIEKDVWVVRALDALRAAPFGEHLVFKGGTSLSKAYGDLGRFSEDVDLTFDMRELAPDVVGRESAPLPASSSQARKWSEEIQRRLRRWVAETVLPHISEALPVHVRIPPEDPSTLLLDYDAATAATAYTSHTLKLEFGARSTGEPSTPRTITCDAASALPMLAFPSARPRVMHAERTFWEKATAIHVFVLSGRFRGTSRFARHWYDLTRLDNLGIAGRAFDDTSLAHAVADHKARFFAEKDRDGVSVDYRAAVEGGLRLVPTDGDLAALHDDYTRMLDDGLVLGEPPLFAEIITTCRSLEDRATRDR